MASRPQEKSRIKQPSKGYTLTTTNLHHITGRGKRLSPKEKHKMETLTLQEKYDRLNEKYESLKKDLEAERKGRDYWIAIAGKRLKIIENTKKALKI